jgi:hypothetical protein
VPFAPGEREQSQKLMYAMSFGLSAPAFFFTWAPVGGFRARQQTERGKMRYYTRHSIRPSFGLFPGGGVATVWCCLVANKQRCNCVANKQRFIEC